MNFVKEQMDPEEKAIIFCGKKARADDLSSEFSLAGICCSCIHGDRDQSDREQALRKDFLLLLELILLFYFYIFILNLYNAPANPMTFIFFSIIQSISKMVLSKF